MCSAFTLSQERHHASGKTTGQISAVGILLVLSAPHALASDATVARMEAEGLKLGGAYKVESDSKASNGKRISAKGSTGDGVASYAYSGADKSYRLDVVYMDENDGKGMLKVAKNGQQVGSVVFDKNTSTGFDGIYEKATVVDSLPLSAGDTLTFYGVQDGGEHVRLDYLELVELAPPPPAPVPSDAVARMEAEGLKLGGAYKVESDSKASNGKRISAKGSTGDGVASYAYSGADKSYRLDVVYMDENDGKGMLKVAKNGQQVGSVVFDKNTSTGFDGIYEKATVVDSLPLSAGDTLTFYGVQDGGEHVRLDYLELVELAPPPPAPVPSDAVARMEAEGLKLGGAYKVESDSKASNGKRISAKGSTGDGVASYAYSGADKSYRLDVVYMDENDGKGMLKVAKNGQQVGSVVFDKNTSTGFDGIYEKATVVDSLPLSAGDTLTFYGVQDGGEHVRLDYLELVELAQPGPVGPVIPPVVTVPINKPAVVSVVEKDRSIDSVRILSGPENGTAVVEGGSAIKYEPKKDYAGSDSIHYEIVYADGSRLVKSMSVQVACETCAGGVSLSLSWNENPAADKVEGYRVYRGTDASNASQLVSEITNTSTTYDAWNDLRLGMGDRVCFRVKAFNSAGESGFSDAACETL